MRKATGRTQATPGHDGRDHRAMVAAEHLLEERLLGAEVMVDGALGEARGGGDALD